MRQISEGMKKALSATPIALALSALMVFALPNALVAHADDVDGAAAAGFEYTLDEASETITLTKYVGSETNVTVAAEYQVGGGSL